MAGAILSLKLSSPMLWIFDKMVLEISINNPVTAIGKCRKLF